MYQEIHTLFRIHFSCTSYECHRPGPVTEPGQAKGPWPRPVWKCVRPSCASSAGGKGNKWFCPSAGDPCDCEGWFRNPNCCNFRPRLAPFGQVHSPPPPDLAQWIGPTDFACVDGKWRVSFGKCPAMYPIDFPRLKDGAGKTAQAP